MTKIFGTDGIRGLANAGNLSIEFLLKLIPAVLEGRSIKRVVIGNDTRISSDMLVCALSAIFNTYGIDVYVLGCVPTPALSYITKHCNFDIGIMVTASHNPYQDNGIKLFNSSGLKFSVKDEEQIAEYLIKNSKKLVTHAGIGRTTSEKTLIQEYEKFVYEKFDGLDLSDLKIVVDCANGAFFEVVKRILGNFKSNIIYLSDVPNGVNINDNCGAVYPTALCNEVIQNNADIGLAFDGDGDRVVICDENGDIVDGDHLIGFLAICEEEVKHVAVTEISNLSLDKFLNDSNIKVTRTNVGDKFIATLVSSGEAQIGGEKSGHIIVNKAHPTGDGLVAALTVLSLLKTFRDSASVALRQFELAPSVSRNVFIKDKNIVNSNAIKNVLALYANDNNIRILVRASGTESVIRIIVEGIDSSKINLIANELEDICKTSSNA